jgi:hypothetical protein
MQDRARNSDLDLARKHRLTGATERTEINFKLRFLRGMLFKTSGLEEIEKVK